MIPVYKDDLADQSGDPLQYVADLRDIARPDPGRRQLTSPFQAADLMRVETIARVQAICAAQSGDPVVLLSGGVDSILVAAAAVAAGYRPHAITVVTASGTDQTNAVAAAKALGLPHDVVELDDDAIDKLAREAVTRLPVPELWEVSYAVPILAAAQVLDRFADVGPILTGNAADAILAGGKVLQHPLTSAEAIEEVDHIIRKESAANFRRERLVPDFHERVIPQYAGRFTHVFQTVRFWDLTTQFAPQALFADTNGTLVDKECLRLACNSLLPEPVKSLAWAKKSPIQRSAGIMEALAMAARRTAAALPGAQTYGDPMNESYESVATRLYLALLDDRSEA